MCLKKKNLNAHRPSEHPPVWGKNVKTYLIFVFVYAGPPYLFI